MDSGRPAVQGEFVVPEMRKPRAARGGRVGGASGSGEFASLNLELKPGASCVIIGPCAFSSRATLSAGLGRAQVPGAGREPAGRRVADDEALQRRRPARADVAVGRACPGDDEEPDARRCSCAGCAAASLGGICSGRSSLTIALVATAPVDSFSAFRAPDTVTKAQQAVERKPAKPYTLNTQRTIVGESPHPPDGRPSPAGPSPAVSHPDTPVDHLLDEVRRPASRHKASLFFLESFFDQKSCTACGASVEQEARLWRRERGGVGVVHRPGCRARAQPQRWVRSSVLSISAICARSDSVVPGFCSARMRGGQRR